jgi:hypothetical protein
MDKLVLNCTTGEMEEVAFTPEEIAQREYEASLPPVIPPKTELELLEEKYTMLQGALDFVIMNF